MVTASASAEPKGQFKETGSIRYYECAICGHKQKAAKQTQNVDVKDKVSASVKKTKKPNQNQNQKQKQKQREKEQNRNEGYLAKPSKYNKLIVSLRRAQAKEYSLDKEQTSYSDSLDALRLSLKGYNIR
ncbi:MAG TPA: hypothetical protein VJ250_00265 [Nitrososphaeraceae archaeon]|nr:hypothetical protein [Nitrososphaeraceae archaeon]